MGEKPERITAWGGFFFFFFFLQSEYHPTKDETASKTESDGSWDFLSEIINKLSVHEGSFKPNTHFIMNIKRSLQIRWKVIWFFQSIINV